MLKTSKTENVTVKLSVSVILTDISGGKCLLPTKCMEKVAIERALREHDKKGGNHHVKVDAGLIKFQYDGYKWHCPTPKKAKIALLQFDKETKIRKRVEARGEEFVSSVRPHSYTIIATRGNKVTPMPSGRQEQINAARKKRILAGHPDKKKYDFHSRVLGHANVTV